MSDYYWRLMQAGVMGLILTGYDADEATVISSWIDITRQALKESGYKPR